MISLTSEIFDSSGLTIAQPAKGHRYGPESIALAEFVSADAGQRAVELGSGVGVISLMIAARTKGVHVTAVEIQRSLHQIAVRNVCENGFENSVACVNGDYRKFAVDNGNAFDIVVSNPPFYAAEHGRMSPDAQRAQARHELSGTIGDLVHAAGVLLRAGGTLAIVFDRRRMDELRRAADDAGFEVIRIEEPAGCSFVLIEFVR